MPMVSPKAPDPGSIDWFDDSTLREGLGVRSARGFSLTFGAQVLKLVVNTGATAVLARLLAPGDFGLVAMLVSVTGVAHIFRDLGLPLATVQRTRITDAECNSIFWLTLLIGVAVTALVALSGPVLASFFGDPRVALIAPAISLTFLFASLGSQHQALLRRRMRFGALASIELGSTGGSYLLAILLAWRGAGFWALALQQVAFFCFSSVCLWIACSWRPGRPTWVRSVYDMIGFGRNVTLSNLMNYAGRNVDNVLIGKVSGAAALGYYSKAYQLLLLPIWQINTPIGAVVMPALSRLQNEAAEFRRFYLKAVLGMVALGMPVVAFMFSCADEFILLFLGPGWEQAAHLFRLLAPAAFMDTFNLAGGLVLHALGHTGRQLRLTVVSTLLILAAFGIGVRWGAEGVAIAFSAVIVLLRFPAIAYSYIDSPVRLRDLLECIWRPAAISVCAGAALYFFPHRVNGSLLELTMWLAVEGAVFATLYLIGWIVIPGGRASIQDAIATWRRVIGSRG
jgi:O-antigen/teichoic acid export membrane protein